MIALLSMTNPLWEFIIGPFIFIALGWKARSLIDRYSTVTLKDYDVTEEEI